jgi:hypothetical protein
MATGNYFDFQYDVYTSRFIKRKLPQTRLYRITC